MDRHNTPLLYKTDEMPLGLAIGKL